MLLCMILKVIGLVLLFLLLLLLLLLGLVLLVPIRYAGAGHKGEEAADYAAHIELSWLLHMVQLHAGITPAGLAYSLRILCFHPGDRRKPDTPTANVSDEASSRSEEATATDATAAEGFDEVPSENEAEASPDDTAVDASDGFALPDEYTDVELKQSPEDEKKPEESVNVPESKAEASERAAAQTAEVDSIELKNSTEPAVQTEEKLTSEDVPGSDETEDASADVDQESKTKSTVTTAEAPKKKKRKKSSFADRIKRICEKASSLRETVEDEENQKAVRLLLSRVKYLLHHLRFRKFEGRLAFGFEDPAMVGRMLAVLSLFYPLYGECFTITPVFDHTLFEGEIALKGHVRLIHILIAGIQLMMNKKIRGLVLDRI